MKDNRGCHGHQPKTDESLIQGVKEFINSIPKIESHYIRANSQRLYIDGSKNIADLHHDYVEGCKEKDVDYVNYVMFYRIFNKDFNISFFTPKKDYADEDFKRAVVIKKKKEINVDVNKAYTAKPGISQKKKAGLMELVNKNLIPRYYRSFYESL